MKMELQAVWCWKLHKANGHVDLRHAGKGCKGVNSVGLGIRTN